MENRLANGSRLPFVRFRLASTRRRTRRRVVRPKRQNGTDDVGNVWVAGRQPGRAQTVGMRSGKAQSGKVRAGKLRFGKVRSGKVRFSKGRALSRSKRTGALKQPMTKTEFNRLYDQGFDAGYDQGYGDGFRQGFEDGLEYRYMYRESDPG